ncbi:MAG: hypothetical protein RLZZ67_674 [Candidatus Parcubacteria bacterium]|jgi:2,3-bisphosphoglycerate-dependent phosphoglycerate mutase
MAKLIIVRHHESEWNKLGLWTGKRDRHLTPYGFKKSEEMSKLITGMQIDQAFASMQVRSIETLSCILESLGLYDVPTEHAGALNERDYGDYTGKSKWDMEKLVGTDVWNKIRREWDFPVPNGETLKNVYNRAVPFFLKTILPHVVAGENVILVSHGNAIRALVKYIEDIPDEKIKDVEMLFGGVLIYELTKEGKMVSKEIRKVESTVNA